MRDDISISRRRIQIERFVWQAGLLLALSGAHGGPSQRHMIVLDPGHSHAAAVFAEKSAELSDDVHVYAPPGPDVNAFLESIARLNLRSQNPTQWHVKPYIGPDFMARLQAERPGNIVVISGRNDGKISEILASLRMGQNVLADKPWIIDSSGFSQLETAMTLAEKRRLVAFDCMTERFSIAYRIQRELMRDGEVFGRPLAGTASEPGVVLQNLHSVVKFDHGRVNLRPSWFFDVRQQGEAIADVGTHLVDLEMWTLFPDQAIDYRRDIKVLKATHSPIFLTRAQFARVTGEQTWPEFLRRDVSNDQLTYDCNNTAEFTLRGIHTAISDRWEYESTGALNDTYLVLYRGTRATIRVRQSKLENYVPQIVVIPKAGENLASFNTALEKRLKALTVRFPGLAAQHEEGEIRISIPEADRERGGSTFGQLVAQFQAYVRNPQSLPSWEKPNMLAKYYLTTEAVKVARYTR